MATLTEAIAKLRPGVNFANTNGTLAGVRWDTPNVTPPTQEEVDAAKAEIDNPTPPTAAEKFATATGLTLAELKALIASN